MRTIRRLYFFAVAFISVEVVVWGLISLLRTTFSSGFIFPGAEALAKALALILVGVPIFLLHWSWAQRAAFRDGDEHAATLRAVFLYGILLATLIPVVQNILALFNRTLLTLAGIESYRALVGGTQTWVDNLLAILCNALVAAYFFNIVRTDWATLLDKENFRDIRRLYRYIWLLYSLLMAIYGIQQVVHFLFYIPTAILGMVGNEMFLNGVALIIVGAPIWARMWMICQRALDEEQETGSMLRLGVLYLLALAGVITVLSAAGVLVDVILRRALGEVIAFADLVSQLGSPISVGVPLGVVWAYYGHWLGREIATVSDRQRRAGLNRFYYYILAFIGLVATFTGLALLFSFVVEALVGSQFIWGEVLRNRLSGAVSTLLAGLPLWLIVWRPMQAEAFSSGDIGDHARRSLVRRIYLYLAIFATVIGGMASAIWLFYTLLYALLGQMSENFTVDALNALQLLALFVAFLVYHGLTLRRDGGHTADALAARQGQFPVLIYELGGSGFALQVAESLKRIAPVIPVAVQPVEQGIPEDADAARAVVLPSTLAFNPPEALRLWLKAYTGQKIIVPVEVEGWNWPGGVPRNGISQAANMLRQLSEGQELRAQGGSSAWQTVANVFAILFALEILFFLVVLGISLVTGG